MTGFRWSFGVVGECVAADVPPPGGLRSGSLFAGRYRIVEPLGRGGGGHVFRAEDQVLSRQVALKVLPELLRANQRERFLREGELTARLSHPGIVRVHGGGVSEEGRAFLVLEVVEGARTLIQATRERPEDGLELLVQAARAVGAAHRKSIVHRDLKPENILVDDAGRVRVCDFGLASELGLDRLTKTGQMLGTPYYMAPEQFSASSGEPPGPATDVWALGVLLYEALTGQLPFDGATLSELMAQVAQGSPPPPRKLGARANRSVEAVCLRALSKDPVSRQRDGSEFADALERALRDGGRRVPVAPFVADGVALLLGGVLWKTSADPEPAPSPAAVTQVRSGPPGR